MMKQELEQKTTFFSKSETVETIYFGGGTPSLLSADEIGSLLNTVRRNYNIGPNPEITLECNPDDLNPIYLAELFEVGVNRLSIGIQSFDDAILKWMNRSHTNNQSLACIEAAGKVGFKDLTIDLIYGVPGLTDEKWTETIDFALKLPINHLSAYGLTLEQNTPYAKLVAQKKYKEPSDESTSNHYEILIDRIKKANWEHYEVSNYCKSGNYSKHNTSYWQQKKYLGVGPSAHSFDLKNRYWNVNSNKSYVDKMQVGETTWEFEMLTNTDKLNEVLLTGLRTQWGVNIEALKINFGYNLLARHADEFTYWKNQGQVIIDGEWLKLTEKGWLFADYISSQLFVDQDYSSQTSS